MPEFRGGSREASLPGCGMKLLLDQNLSRHLLADLGKVFPGSSHVEFSGLAEASDEDVWRYVVEVDVREFEDLRSKLSTAKVAKPRVTPIGAPSFPPEVWQACEITRFCISRACLL